MFPRPDYQAFFEAYAAEYEKAREGRMDLRALRAYFAEGFVAADTTGRIVAGSNDGRFDETLRRGYGFYMAIGTRRMRVEHIEVQPMYENHDRVRVFYCAEYVRPGGEELVIPYDLVYLLQRRADGPRIFAYIAGDEMGLYRRHGLVDEQHRPQRAAT
jgi:hypothetical protein